jgi:hypothetical protein
MKITKLTLNILAIILIIIIVFKLVYWLITDIPISRGSMLILISSVVLLLVKNRYTYFLLFGLMLFCITYKVINQHWSGYLMVDFMSSIRESFHSAHKVFFYTPYAFYFLTIFLMILPTTRKIYFKTNK